MNYYTSVDSAAWTGFPVGDLVSFSRVTAETIAYQFNSEDTNASIHESTGETWVAAETYNRTNSKSSKSYMSSGSSGSTFTGSPYGATHTGSSSQSGYSTDYQVSADTSAGSSFSAQSETGGFASAENYFAHTTPFGTGDYVASVDSGSGAGSINSFTTPTSGASSSVRTLSMSSRDLSTSAQTFDYSTHTSISNDDLPRVTTSSWSVATTVGTIVSSTVAWNTIVTYINQAYTTLADLDFDSGNAVTGPQDFTSAITEDYVSGTFSGTREKLFPATFRSFSPLRNTVILMNEGKGAGDWNMGNVLWTFSRTGANFTDTSLSVFSDLYASVSGNTFTFSDLRMFSTSEIILSAATVGFSTTSGTAGSGIITLTNGIASSGATSQTHSTGYAMGDVASFLSTSSNSSTAGSSTVYTHTDFVSGYATSGALPFTTGTSTGFWSATSTSGTHKAWDVSTSTTVLKNSRVTTTYAGLASSHTITGSGTSTGLYFLGMVSYQLSTTLISRVALTENTYLNPFSVSVYTLSNTGEAYTQSTVRAESGGFTNITSQRAGLEIAAISPLHTMQEGVWFTVHPRGYLGFGGSFTQPDQAVYLTTQQGLAAGATFTTASLQPPSMTADLQNGAGVTFFPVNPSNPPSLVGDGLENSSMVSIPTSVVTAILVAATWTSTYATGSSISTSSRLATHTLGVVSAITGEFHCAEEIQMNSADANIGINGLFAPVGGYAGGDNMMLAPSTVRLALGRVSWTDYSAGASSNTGATGSTQNTHGTVSFVVASGKAIRFSAEPLISAWWTTNGFDENNHFTSTTPHQIP